MEKREKVVSEKRERQHLAPGTTAPAWVVEIMFEHDLIGHYIKKK